MWPRYGSFPGFNPIVELSLTFHNLVVGANGQRQAMFLENVSGLAERILARLQETSRAVGDQQTVAPAVENRLGRHGDRVHPQRHPDP